MFDKAVVCTDLSPDSDLLVGCAGGLSVLGVREAVLTHVVDIFRDPRGMSLGTPEAEDAFERQLAMLEDSGYAVHVEAPMGLPAFSLEEVRRRHAASLIVVGSHGRGVFGQPFSGSTSSDLVQLSQTPVFVAALGGAGSLADSALACGRVLGKVLCCTDFSEAADQAFLQAEELARLGAREFVLMHVRDTEHVAEDGSDTLADRDRRDAVRLSHMREALLAVGADHVEIRVTDGSPGRELALRAASDEFTLIVMGSGGQGDGRDVFLGRVSDRVVREARTPLLLVPVCHTRARAALV